MEIQADKLLTIREAASFLKISISTIDKLQASGDFPPSDYVISKVKKRLWKIQTLTTYLETQCRNPKKNIKDEQAS